MSRAAVVCARGERAPNLQNNTDDDSAMQAFAELSRLVAHDVRTPLNALLGFSSMLSQELFGPIGNERYREYAGHIANSAHQTVQAAERTIALAALTPQFPHCSPKGFMNLRSIIEDAVIEAGSDVAPKIGHQICETLEVWVEQKAFQQAISHILTGARHLDVRTPGFTTNSERPFVSLTIDIDPGVPEQASTPSLACAHGNARIQFLFAQTLFRLAGALVQLKEVSPGSWRFQIQLEASAQEAFPIA